MTPVNIAKREETFASTLKDSNGHTWTLKNTIDLGKGIKLKQIALKYSSYYYTSKEEKDKICLHFTVGVLPGDIATLSKEDNHVSVHFVVARDGTVYQLMDDDYWSYHLGSNCVGSNGTMSKKSFGIEISNYGPLKLQNDKLMDAYGTEYCKKSELEYYTAVNYRGYSYYATMTEIQETAVAQLLLYITSKHNIPLIFKEDLDQVFESAVDARNFKGIYPHTAVRKDKFDWPAAMLQGIIKKCYEPTSSEEHDEKQVTVVLPEVIETKEETIVETKEEVKEEPIVETKEETKVEEKKEEPKKENVAVSTTKKISGFDILSIIIDFIKSLFKKS